MKTEILSVPDCPNASGVRELLWDCLERLGMRVEVVERVGDFPSPTILVNEVDVMGARAVHGGSCRLDLPTEDRILAALRAAAR